MSGRGYEKNEPRDVIVRLRLTQSEADVINDMAERFNRPVTKVILSAITTACFCSSLNAELIRRKTGDFGNIADEITKLYHNTTDEAERKKLEPLVVLLNVVSITLLRFGIDSDRWLDLEMDKPTSDQYKALM
jgi:hypothetical protein